MVGKALGVGTVASLVLSLAIAKGGDIALPGGGDVVTGGSSVDFYSSDGSVESSWRGIAIDITAADTVTVGQSGGVGMEWEVDRIAFRHDGGILRLVTAADGGTTRLTVETLTMDSGGRIDISDGGNSLTVHSFTTANAGDITFSVGNGSSLMVTDQADLTLGSSSSSVDFLLDHGTSSFAGSVTLASGSLSAAGTSCFQVGGTGLGVGSTARISVADNGLLTIRDSSDAALGRLVVDGGELEIGNDATLAVGDLILRDVTFSAASGTGTLRSESLTTSGLVVDSDAVATVVSGATVVESGNYYVRGDSNRYAGGIIVQNSAQLSSYIGGAVIFLGDQDARQRLVMAEGATLRAWMGDLVIHHAAVEVVGLGVTVAATSGGNLDLSTSSLAIALAATDTVSIQPEDTITAGSYYQSGGIATVTASGSGHFTVLGTATITDGATYQVADSATQFAHGVTIADAVVAGITAAGSITVGDGDQAGDIFLAGGAVLLADTLSGHSLAVHENGSGSTLRVGGSNNAVYGKVDCGDLEVIVAGDAATDGPALWVAGSGGDGFLVGSLRVDSGEVILGSDAVPFAAGSQGGLLRSFGNVVVASGGSLASDHTSNYILSEWNSGT
ncbi:MAG: hypothetical protein LIP77_08610, partial [Planctomycetes bacterium]|nr:hypothetical protein [Planctomycetota bacterium]